MTAPGSRSPLGWLLGSEARARVLSALLFGPHATYYVRSLAAATGLVPTAVSRELITLERLGLVRRRTDGRRMYCELNPEAATLGELSGLVLKMGGLPAAVRGALERGVRGIRWAFLFGPSARGASTGAIDLMVVVDTDAARIAELLRPIGERLGREIRAHVLTPGEFRAKKGAGHYFLSQVLQGPRLLLIGSARDAARDRRADDPPASSIDAAAEYGIDIDLLRANLRLTPAERLAQLDANQQAVSLIQRARRAG